MAIEDYPEDGCDDDDLWRCADCGCDMETEDHTWDCSYVDLNDEDDEDDE